MLLRPFIFLLFSPPYHALIELEAEVRVVDNLSSGKIQNIQGHIDTGRIEFIHADLMKPNVAQQCVEGIEIVFHLAADHGGRGYVDLHEAACATNLILDNMVFWHPEMQE